MNQKTMTSEQLRQAETMASFGNSSEEILQVLIIDDPSIKLEDILALNLKQSEKSLLRRAVEDGDINAMIDFETREK